ncbi:MAG: DUF374 domain-containing protein [Alphaproteobacteria bacterium]|nr:DUF374 domain-containing protein [Alphaproteobacteria bacterium]
MLRFIRRLDKKLGRPIEMLLRYSVFLLFSCYYLLVAFSTRIEEHNGDIPRKLRANNQLFAVSTWHGRLLYTGFMVRRKLGGSFVAFNSPHLDGQMLAWLHLWFGIKTVYGAPNKNPERGMMNLLKYVKKHKCDLLITPDGPKGPRQRVKRGVIAFAKISDVPIIPFVSVPYKGVMLKSWDRFVLAMPFTKIIVLWGEPVFVDKKADKDAQTQAQQLLEDRMNHLLQEVDKMAGRETPAPAPYKSEI